MSSINQKNDGNLLQRLSREQRNPLQEEVQAELPPKELSIDPRPAIPAPPANPTHLPTAYPVTPQPLEAQEPYGTPVISELGNNPTPIPQSFNVTNIQTIDFKGENKPSQIPSVSQDPTPISNEPTPMAIQPMPITHEPTPILTSPTPLTEQQGGFMSTSGPKMLDDSSLTVQQVVGESLKSKALTRDAHLIIEQNKQREATIEYSFDDLEKMDNFKQHDERIRESIIAHFKKDVEELGITEANIYAKKEEKAKKREEFNKNVHKFNLALIRRYFLEQQIEISDGLIAYYAKYLLDDMYNLSILTDLLKDTTITEIWVPRYDQVEIEIKGKPFKTKLKFRDWTHMKDVIDRITAETGRKLNDTTPNIDARLADKSRLSASIPPVAVYGPELTIRKFPEKPYEPEDLLKFGSINEELLDHIEMIVKRHLSLFVSGGTGAGKTTFLNVVSNFVNHDQRVIVIENTHELNLNLPHVVYLEERISENNAISMNQLVINTLRKAPKCIIAGEVRGGEAFAMLQGLSTGHYGYATGHANDPENLFQRLNSMVLMAGVTWDMATVNRFICNAIQYIVQIDRMEDGTRKVTRLTEILGVDQEGAERYGRLVGSKSPKIHDISKYGSGHVYLHDIYRFEEEGKDENGKVLGKWIQSVHKPFFYNILNRDGRLTKYWEKAKEE